MNSESSPVSTETAYRDAGRLQCMTVWGGNSPTSQAFDVSGLRIWVHSRVHGDADHGGDIYYVTSCASGRVTRLLVADVSGHGPAVSGTAAHLRETMASNVNRIKQENIVCAVNREFSDRNEGSGFATAVVGTYFAPTAWFTLSNAGHPPPLLYRKAKDEWSIYQSQSPGEGRKTNLPLGVVAETRFDESRIRFHPGDMLLLYTDAFSEARDANGEIIGTNGLCRLVQSLDRSEPDRLVARLTKAIGDEAAGNLNKDDATIVLIQATGIGTPWKNSLTAPFRYLGALLGLRPVAHVNSGVDAESSSC